MSRKQTLLQIERGKATEEKAERTHRSDPVKWGRETETKQKWLKTNGES